MLSLNIFLLEHQGNIFNNFNLMNNQVCYRVNLSRHLIFVVILVFLDIDTLPQVKGQNYARQDDGCQIDHASLDIPVYGRGLTSLFKLIYLLLS